MVERNSAYWATIAQILPVVMLALVVEGRAMARSLAKKKRYPHNRAQRVWYAALFVFNCVGIYVAFQVALTGASGATVSRRWTFVAEMGLALGVATVFLTPILTIGSALVGDWLMALHRRMPYSRASRRHRYASRMYAEIVADLREGREDARRQRLATSREYVKVYRFMREDAHSEEHFRLAHARIDELEQFDRNLSDFETKFQAVEARARRLLKEDESAKELSDEDLRNLRSLVLASAIRA